MSLPIRRPLFSTGRGVRALPVLLPQLPHRLPQRLDREMGRAEIQKRLSRGYLGGSTEMLTGPCRETSAILVINNFSLFLVLFSVFRTRKIF
jgi:hypothetical protein